MLATDNAELAVFEKNGYAQIRNVVDADTIARLRKTFLSELDRHKTSLLVDGVVRYQEMRDLLNAPKLLNVLTALLGKPFLVLRPTSVDHNRFGQYHTDMSGAELNGVDFHKQKDFRAIVLGVYLQDNNQHGGGLRVVPGTHLVPDPYVEMLKEKHAIREKLNNSFLRRGLKKLSGGRLYDWKQLAFEHVPGEVDVPTKAGDALVWDMRLVHRASPRQVPGEGLPGGKIAIFYTLGSNTPATRKWMDYHFEIEAEKPREPGTVVPPPTNDYIIL